MLLNVIYVFSVVRYELRDVYSNVENIMYLGVSLGVLRAEPTLPYTNPSKSACNLVIHSGMQGV